MNKIIYDIELQPIQSNESVYEYYYQPISKIKNRKDCVKLSLYCSKYCFEYNSEITKSYAQKCIDLVESWLINPKSVTEQELRNASDAANAANACWSLYYCSQIPNINMNLPNQYLQTLLKSTKQFNTENHYSKTIEQIVKQDVDKLELVDYNMLLDISNEYYNIDLSEFNYDNIFSRRNLIEMIRREYNE